MSVGLGCLDLPVHSARTQRVPKVGETVMWCSLSMILVPSCRSASVESAVHRGRAAEGRCAVVVVVVVVLERFEAQNAYRGKGHTLCENHMQTTTEDGMRWLGVCRERQVPGMCGSPEEVRSITHLGGTSQGELGVEKFSLRLVGQGLV